MAILIKKKQLKSLHFIACILMLFQVLFQKNIEMFQTNNFKKLEVLLLDYLISL